MKTSNTRKELQAAQAEKLRIQDERNKEVSFWIIFFEKKKSTITVVAF